MRVLVTGISTYWGGRLAQAIEQDTNVEAIIGVGPDDPTCELERTEFVRVGLQHALLRRIVDAAEIDTVVDARLVVDSLMASPRQAHETNVIGTMNILAACGGPHSPVRKVVFKSSAHYYGCEQDDPAFFTEGMRRPHAPRTRLEADIVEAEKAVDGFAQRNPEVTVTVLRFCNALGPDLRTTHTRLFDLPAVPGHPRLRPALPVHPRGGPGRRAALRRRARPAGHLQRGRRRRAGTVGGRVAARQAAGPDPAAVGQLAGRRGAAPARRARLVGGAQPAPLRPRARQPQAQGGRLSVRATRAGRRCSSTPRPSAHGRCGVGRGSPTATSARSRSSCAGAPVSAGRALCNARPVAGVLSVRATAYHLPTPCRAV